MTNKQPRFSRRFLTILMIVTAMAILLLSRMQPSEQTTPESEQPPASTESGQS